MSDQSEYYLDPTQRILNLMRDTFGNTYQYFLGSPSEIPDAAYPCFVVQPVSSLLNAQSPTGADDVGEQINIEVLFNSKDDLNAPDDADTTMRRIYQVVQGRDPLTGMWLSNTVIGALRKNLTLGTSIIDQDFTINYDVNQRIGAPLVMLGIVTVVVRERIFVGTRT